MYLRGVFCGVFCFVPFCTILVGCMIFHLRSLFLFVFLFLRRNTVQLW